MLDGCSGTRSSGRRRVQRGCQIYCKRTGELDGADPANWPSRGQLARETAGERDFEWLGIGGGHARRPGSLNVRRFIRRLPGNRDPGPVASDSIRSGQGLQCKRNHAMPTPSPAVASKRRAAQLYEADGYSWGLRQAAALRARDLDAIDWEHVAEEIEDVARRYRDRWVRQCARAVEHLLKIEHYEPDTAGVLKHWRAEVRNFRDHMAAAVRRNPGLQGEYDAMLDEAWERGRHVAVRRMTEYAEEREEGLSERALRRRWNSRVPEQCPYRLEHVTAFDLRRHKVPQNDVWPPGVAVALNTRLGTDYAVRRGPGRRTWKGWRS